MENIFLNTRNSKTKDSNRFRLCYTWKNIKEQYNNKFKLIGPTWDETFDLPDESYTVADI